MVLRTFSQSPCWGDSIASLTCHRLHPEPHPCQQVQWWGCLGEVTEAWEKVRAPLPATGVTQQCKWENYICNPLAMECAPVKQQNTGHFCVTLLGKVAQGVVEFMEIWIQLGASGSLAFVLEMAS